MAFYKRKQLECELEEGRVYLLKLHLDDKTVYKIGITFSERVEDRMMEILLSFFKAYRYIPKTVLKKNIKTKIPRTFEKHIHHMLKDYSYTFSKKFNGYTEFFTDIDEKTLINYMTNLDYKAVLEGVDRMPIKEYNTVKEELDKDKEKLLDGILPF